jgi:hypothetical protein
LFLLEPQRLLSFMLRVLLRVNMAI